MSYDFTTRAMVCAREGLTMQDNEGNDGEFRRKFIYLHGQIN